MKTESREVILSKFLRLRAEITRLANALGDISELRVKQPKTTKASSLSVSDLPELDRLVLAELWENPGQSRYELSVSCKKRLSSICGAVNRLIEKNLAHAEGEIYDAITGRKCELLWPTDPGKPKPKAAKL